jgi:hypothetical protein
MAKETQKEKKVVKKAIKKFGKGELHSGSKKGPVVENRKQAVAIDLSEAKEKPSKMKRKGCM